jgi:hypothetical protein
MRFARAAPILGLVTINLALGFALTPHYGQSSDEAQNVVFGRGSFGSYSHPDDPYLDPEREDKGPFFLMAWTEIGGVLGRTIPGWVFADGRHFVNLVTFQLAVVSVYGIALRLVPPWAAFSAAVLFETQPVLFGHAFINQKDMPFMAFFAAAITAGLAAADRVSAFRSQGSPGLAWEALRAAAARDPARARRAGAACVALGLTLVLLLIAEPIPTAADTLLRAVYSGRAWEPLNRLFRSFAQHAAEIPVEAYLQRARPVVHLASLLASGLAAAVGSAAVIRLWPEGPRVLLPAWERELRDGWKMPVPALAVGAGVILGMAVAIRSTALFAGLLVAGYALARAGLRSLGLLVAGMVTAAFTTYALWPQLWGSGWRLLSSSLGRTLYYPELEPVLFDGLTFFSTSLPASFLPTLLAVQITVPAIVLGIAGLWVVLGSRLGRDSAAPLVAVLLLWAAAPFAAVVVFRVPIYNNFRHVLFMLPPLFVMAGLALDRLGRRVPRAGARVALAAAVILPGMVGIVRLHPYEYGYYNEAVGGVRGAFGRYLSDYWCTSYREAMRFVNAYAPPSSAVAVFGPETSAAAFARPDLTVRDVKEIITDPQFRPRLVLGCSWTTIDPAFFPDAPVVFSVRREGVPLAIVKQLSAP